MQRRIKQTNGTRQAFTVFDHDAENRGKVVALHGEDFRECHFPARFIFRQNHLAEIGETVRFKEHVLCAAKTNPFCAEINRGLNIERRFRICPHAQSARRVCPSHDLGKITREFGLDHIHRAREDLACGPVDRDNVARLDGAAHNREFLGIIINPDFACTGDTRRTHAARNNGGVRGHAPARGDNRFGGVHAVDIFGRGFNADQNDLNSGFRFGLGLIRSEDHFANRCAGRGRQAHRDNIARRIRR